MPFFDFFSRKKISADLPSQLETLARCGITLNKRFDAKWLATHWGDTPEEGWTFTQLLCAMGDNEETPPFAPISNNIWHFDTEYIEDDGSYEQIVKRMGLLAGGALDFREVTDHVDLKERTGWVEFMLDGQKFHWDAEINEDWADTKILSKVADLLAKKNLEKRFTYYDLGGQDCLIGCATREQMNLLNQSTGMKFEWLK